MHPLGLDYPGALRLVEQGEEHRDEHEDDRQPEQNLENVLVQDLPDDLGPGRADVHILSPSQEEGHRRDDHQHCRDPEAGARAPSFQQERAEIISSFYFVDYVTFFRENKVDKVLLALEPHVHAKGSDYSVDTVPEKETVKKYGGEIAITGGPKIKSTSEVIEEVAARFKNFKDKSGS